jgi:hypothetical protein
MTESGPVIAEHHLAGPVKSGHHLAKALHPSPHVIKEAMGEVRALQTHSKTPRRSSTVSTCIRRAA